MVGPSLRPLRPATLQLSPALHRGILATVYPNPPMSHLAAFFAAAAFVDARHAAWQKSKMTKRLHQVRVAGGSTLDRRVRVRSTLMRRIGAPR